MKRFLPSRKAAETLGVHANTLRNWARNGSIEFIVTKSGHRHYNVESVVGNERKCEQILYCRVSSFKQKDDLARQVSYLQDRFPNHNVIQDIGSGINYKRKGLKSILGKLLNGYKLEIVVAHRDRLARFGFEIIEYLVHQNGGKIVVLNQQAIFSPEQELTQDLLSIIHVFSCRMHGLRKYKAEIKEDKDLS